jgi:DNA-binding protein H-NS
MSSIDLNNLSIPELEDLAKAIASELEKRQSESKRIVLNQIKELAQSIGMTIDDVVGIGKKKRRRGAPLTSKVYVNPENPKETWFGRGRRPNWARDILNRGEALKTLDAS